MKRRRWVWVVFFMLSAYAQAADTWLKVAAPKFTLYSNSNAEEALASANEFQVFIYSFTEIFPVDAKALPPLTIVLFKRSKDFKDFRPLAPNGKPRDNVAGYFARRASWAVFGMVGSELDEELRKTIQHEGVHWLLRSYDIPNPPWLEEGLAEVFSTFSVTRKGQVEWGRSIPELAALLQAEDPLPLRRLFSISQNDPLFNESMRTSLFYAGSWAFVHYMLFSEEARTKPLFENYMKAMRSGERTEEGLRETFNAGFEEVDKKLLSRYALDSPDLCRQREGTWPTTPRM